MSNFHDAQPSTSRFFLFQSLPIAQPTALMTPTPTMGLQNPRGFGLRTQNPTRPANSRLATPMASHSPDPSPTEVNAHPIRVTPGAPSP